MLLSPAAYVCSLEALRTVYYEPLKLLADTANRRLSTTENRGGGGGGGSNVIVMLSLTEIDAVFGNVIFIHAIHKQFFTQFRAVFQPEVTANAATVVEFVKVFNAMFVKVNEAKVVVNLIIIIIVIITILPPPTIDIFTPTSSRVVQAVGSYKVHTTLCAVLTLLLRDYM
jgi:hypothetical protein